MTLFKVALVSSKFASCFFIQSDNLCLVIEIFSPFTFNVIIDRIGFRAAIFLVSFLVIVVILLCLLSCLLRVNLMLFSVPFYLHHCLFF